MEKWSWNHCLNTTGRRTGFVRKGPGHRRDLVRQEIAGRKPEKKTPRARPPTGWITVPTGLRPESGCYTEPWEWVGAGWHPMCFTAVWRCS